MLYITLNKLLNPPLNLIQKKNMAAKPTKYFIKTFIFFDIETTGLPSTENRKTKITELCLNAVRSEHVEMGTYPRIQNKLTLCFNPQKLIQPIAAEITGLTNNMLEHQKAFNKESFSLINSFLELHQKPICLVAHNGNYFDYPILRAEIHNTDSSLSDDILCVDSIQVFKQLHNEELYKAMNIKKENSIKQENTIKQENYKTNTPTLQIRKNRKNKSSKSVEKEEINLTELYYIPGVNYEKKSSTNTVASELNDGFDELLSQVLDNTEEILSKKSFEEVQRLNMMTPTKKSKDSEVASDIANKGRSVKNVNKNFSNVSFKLSDVYRRIAKKEPILAHNAECDVNMLLECAAILGEDFVDWANENARKFNEIPMMKPIN